MSYKYMRIQGREDSYITRYPKGIFSLCWNLVNAGVMDESEKEMFVCIDEWFKSHLPEPEPCVKREKYNRAYDVVYTNFVGEIVYEDKWQIAVKVEEGRMI